MNDELNDAVIGRFVAAADGEQPGPRTSSSARVPRTPALFVAALVGINEGC